MLKKNILSHQNKEKETTGINEDEDMLKTTEKDINNNDLQHTILVKKPYRLS